MNRVGLAIRGPIVPATIDHQICRKEHCRALDLDSMIRTAVQ